MWVASEKLLAATRVVTALLGTQWQRLTMRSERKADYRPIVNSFINCGNCVKSFPAARMWPTSLLLALTAPEQTHLLNLLWKLHEEGRETFLRNAFLVWNSHFHVNVSNKNLAENDATSYYFSASWWSRDFTWCDIHVVLRYYVNVI